MLDVKAFRESRGVTAKQCADAVREQYPGYDKHLHSKVEHPEKYGIRLVLGAEQALEDAFTVTFPEPRKKDNRRLKARISCRMTETKFERLQRAFRQDGYATMQEGVSHLIDRFLEDKNHDEM